jgi:hypothetical protein
MPFNMLRTSLTPAYRQGILAGILLLLCILTLLTPPFDQPADYHQWVDTRTLLGIPYFGDVVSNLGFLWVGLLGLWALARHRCHCDLPGERLAWTLVFVGIALTAFGYWYWTDVQGENASHDQSLDAANPSICGPNSQLVTT